MPGNAAAVWESGRYLRREVELRQQIAKGTGQRRKPAAAVRQTKQHLKISRDGGAEEV